jgi:hypothetical protein
MLNHDPQAIVGFIQSWEMHDTVTRVISGLQNLMETMKRRPCVSESDFKVAFTEPFEKCRSLVYWHDKQTSTGADQSSHWNDQDHRATSGFQMDLAGAESHFPGNNIEGTFDCVADVADTMGSGWG